MCACTRKSVSFAEARKKEERILQIRLGDVTFRYDENKLV